MTLDTNASTIQVQHLRSQKKENVITKLKDYLSTNLTESEGIRYRIKRELHCMVQTVITAISGRKQNHREDGPQLTEVDFEFHRR